MFINALDEGIETCTRKDEINPWGTEFGHKTNLGKPKQTRWRTTVKTTRSSTYRKNKSLYNNSMEKQPWKSSGNASMITSIKLSMGLSKKKRNAVYLKAAILDTEYLEWWKSFSWCFLHGTDHIHSSGNFLETLELIERWFDLLEKKNQKSENLKSISRYKELKEPACKHVQCVQKKMRTRAFISLYLQNTLYSHSILPLTSYWKVTSDSHIPKPLANLPAHVPLSFAFYRVDYPFISETLLLFNDTTVSCILPTLVVSLHCLLSASPPFHKF